MMQKIPNSQFTVGDMIEVEFLQRDRSWKREIGRVVNNITNDLGIQIGNPEDGGWQILPLIEGQYQNARLLEKGPWHNMICGNIKPLSIKGNEVLYDPIDFAE